MRALSFQMDSGIPAAATPDSAIAKWSGKKKQHSCSAMLRPIYSRHRPNSTLFQPHLLNGESRT
jgi:hypothetical protein